MPEMELMDSSSLSVTSVSTCSGEAPGSTVLTITTGKSMFGNRSTPMPRMLAIPTTTSARMSTQVNTGRRTEIAANHCIEVLRLFCYSVTATPSPSRGRLSVASRSPGAMPRSMSTSSP